jgi:Tfp pilus assembly protein PilW
MKKAINLITVIIRRIIAVLKPSTKINDYINNARAVYQSMNGNSWFPATALSIPLATYLADVNALATAETNLTAYPPTGTVSQRNAAKKIVAKDLRMLISDVQKVADANPTNAETIIASAGFAVKQFSTKTKFVGAKNTKVSGTVKLFASEAGHHEWAQLGADGVTWITLRAGKTSTKTVSGLTPGKSYIFRSAPILAEKDGEGAWTVFAPIIVT